MGPACAGHKLAAELPNKTRDSRLLKHMDPSREIKKHWAMCQSLQYVCVAIRVAVCIENACCRMMKPQRRRQNVPQHRVQPSQKVWNKQGSGRLEARGRAKSTR